MKKFVLLLTVAACCLSSSAASLPRIKSYISMKQPGNAAVRYDLAAAERKDLPVVVKEGFVKSGDASVAAVYEVTVTAKNRAVWFNYGAELETDFPAGDCEFYMPGFWYHKNLRSPREAPSFHTSKRWTFREDRLSSPLTSVYNSLSGEGWTVMRSETSCADALTTHASGEVILSGKSTVGYLGIDGEGEKARLAFGYPYVESPRRYTRKLTLADPICAFAKLEAGESVTVRWKIGSVKADDYGTFVAETWNYCFDQLRPEPITPLYTAEEVKRELTNYLREAYVDKYVLKYHSGHGLRIDDCLPVDHVQIGFCGRVLLNGFNALEYGEAHGEADLIRIGNSIFDSWLEHGFTKAGYFLDDFFISRGLPKDNEVVHSIRQQSEAVYAVLLYLKYEKEHGRQHKDWERRIRMLLDNLVSLEKSDGSFARKFHDDGTDIDSSGGSTPSATSALVMGYRYFGDKKYLKAAKATIDYLDKNIISKSDYFSSTLDANCEDKEAAISAVTATYYLAKVTKGEEQRQYVALCQQAIYFALSWYYMWDVPFAEGQMLGDLGLKTRGWGNVSVENNHIDVFVFEFPHILKWLGERLGEERFTRMYDVIYSSLNQLLPVPSRLCGIAKRGFYPEVVQHTHWDYGRNGKGFYNDIFAPAWATASLWELYSPTRTDHFLEK
ncbi:MAG: hypothetical protein IJ624_07300 [Prevotella sp.]|nr:hypothetical protein [Prevotella sp.]